MSWLPPHWDHPRWVELPTGHHLRPIRESDVDIDYPAVMGSQARLWQIFGPVWGWPPADMSFEHDRADLARHEREADAHESFNYALFDADETTLLGCVYIDPAVKVGADADVSWWVVDNLLGTTVEGVLDEYLPEWLWSEWPFTQIRFIGRDISWAQWLTLSDKPR